LFPTRADNTLAEDKVIFVASLISGFSINFRKLIAEEIRHRVTKSPTSLLFFYLMTRLCKAEELLILVKIDVETLVTKRFDIDNMRDESRLEM